ncbi:bifunctional transaldolase/phosoglucose isomerase [Sphingomonas sp.]|uniref:bifunctional transaldolase/phosoglucose isomerase n=1 Tax=Sphingomonas sp. TaxID=28214 RepID=UPI003AFFAC6E
MSNPLNALEAQGQAVWLDFVDRKFMAEGGLKKLVAEDGLTGVTSNPSIFEKAIGHSDAYDDQLKADIEAKDATVETAYEALAIHDIREACDTLRPVYDRLEGKDGYVSIEVSPYLALETETTLAAARRLWKTVDKPNLMVKIPGTTPGTPAIRQALEDGISINVTLLFAVSAYKDVLEAYLAALEARVAKGLAVDRVASVASFFISRIDAVIDKKLDKIGTDEAKALKGKVAIANAKRAYQHYLEVSGSDRWKALEAKGAMPQRLLWASTGVKNPDYPDTLYIDTLIGRDTVNTMPPKTMDAFRDHGTAAATITADLDEAERVLAEADRLGLDLDGVTHELVEDGVRLFADAADALYGAVAAKRTKLISDKLDGMEEELGSLQDKVEETIERARKEGWSRKLWAGDASMWTGKDEGKWLGWLPAAKGERVDLDQLERLSETAKGLSHVVLLGMGGSSLGPEVIARILGSASGYPKLIALDSTDPDQVSTVAGEIDPASTLFFVSSKSGSTMEPELLRAYFWNLAVGKIGEDKAAQQFYAVTDPGSKLEAAAKDKKFADIFLGDPAIGGRYSVLSPFGMAPAAAIGLDVRDFFETTIAPMVNSVGPDAPPADNPGVRLGCIIGTAAVNGRDKLTIVPSPTLKPFGSWLEQLLAESTGKQGKGIVPVDLEPLGDPSVYGEDRLFVHLMLKNDEMADDHAKLDALKAAGHPIVTVTLADPKQIGQEFIRWEVATAVAGAVIGIDPFDQPDVEDAKIQTRDLIGEYEKSGSLKPEQPFAENGPLAFYAPDGQPGGDAKTIVDAFLGQAKPGDYVGFLAYIERNEAHEALIERLRVTVRDQRKVATVAGFGPRFLHSTGQAYKGGPVEGLFVEVTRDPAEDVDIPGSRASFGTVQLAQARGDLDVLASRGQRVLRIHLTDEATGLDALAAAFGA